MHAALEQEIDRYLRSGNVEMRYSAWPGEAFCDRVRYGEKALRAALIEAVRCRRPRRRRGTVPSEQSGAALGYDRDEGKNCTYPPQTVVLQQKILAPAAPG